MKLIDDLTKKEIKDLKDDDIRDLIDKECMQKGIPLLPELPEKPKEPEMKKDKTVYQFYDKLAVEFVEQAEEIVELLKSYNVKQVTKDWDSGARMLEEIPNYSKPEVEVVEVASPQEYERFKKAYESYKEKKEDFDKAKEQREEIKELRHEVSSRVWERVNKVKKEFRERGQIKNAFQRYLELSEGKNEEALKYFKEATDKDLSRYEGLEEELSNVSLDLGGSE